MFTKLKRIILTAAAILALGAPALVPAAVYADTNTPATGTDTIKEGVNCGAELKLDTSTGCGAGVDTGTSSLQKLITNIINIFSVIVGVIAVIMIIVGGLKYITSGGESSNVSGAKNTIIYAIVGLIVVALAQFIVRFVLTNTNNATNGA